MRAVRAPLLSVRFGRSAVFPVLLSCSSARAPTPSRHASTAAAVEGSNASKPIRQAASRGDRLVKEMTPIATFLGIVVTIGAVGAYYSSRLSALEECMIGILKEVDAKNLGSEKAVDAKIAGSEKVVDAKIIGIEKAADLKVRSRSAPGLSARTHARLLFRTHPPPHPHSQYKTK